MSWKLFKRRIEGRVKKRLDKADKDLEKIRAIGRVKGVKWQNKERRVT
jgi:hypothetical protein